MILLFLQIFLTNLSYVNQTLLNKVAIDGTIRLNHKDVFTIIDRSFRLEFPPDSPHCHTTATVMSPSPHKLLSSSKAATPQNEARTPLKDLTPKVGLYSAPVKSHWTMYIFWQIITFYLKINNETILATELNNTV